MEDAVTQSTFEKLLVLGPLLDEQTQRLWAAPEVVVQSVGSPAGRRGTRQ